jgi:hypothetical protein
MSERVGRPDPFREIRPLRLRPVRGANFWSRSPVTRLDLTVGAYDDTSSADVPGVTEALRRALPGLIEHRCSIGERGGFLTRLRRGTYAPHIIEHVALELQSMIGHDVGYGRARGGDRPDEYTVVFEHLHEAVGLRAAARAVEAVQHAFAGSLGSMEPALAELRGVAASPDVAPLDRHVVCGITGGGNRAAVREELLRYGPAGGDSAIVNVPPADVLEAGLPYARSDTAIVLDADPGDVPERYREPERAQRLVSVVADAVPRDGLVVVPAGEREVQELVRDARRRVAVFSTEGPLVADRARDAHATATVRGGRIVLEHRGTTLDAGRLRPDAPADAQLAAALAALALKGTGEDRDAAIA